MCFRVCFRFKAASSAEFTKNLRFFCIFLFFFYFKTAGLAQRVPQNEFDLRIEAAQIHEAVSMGYAIDILYHIVFIAFTVLMG